MSESPQHSNSSLPQFTKDTTQKNVYDSIQLSLQYPDPFLKQSRSRASLPSASNQPAAKPITPPKPVQQPVPKVQEIKPRIFWPQIQYDGTIMSKGSKLAMVRINGQSYIIPLGKSEQEVHVKRIYQDSILLLYKHEEKTVIKK